MNNDQYREALIILAEECSEVVQECSKLLRFHGTTDNLTKEIGDMLVLIDYLHENGMIDLQLIEKSMENKKEKLQSWSTLYE